MKLLRPWQNPFDQQSHNTIPATIANRLDAMERRIANIERILQQRSAPPMRTMADAARWQHDGYGDVMDVMPPWVSNSVRLVGNLSSSDFGRQTRNDALLGGGVCMCLGGIATIAGSLPAYAPLVVGAAGFALTGAALIFHNRTMLHTLVKQQGQKWPKADLNQIRVVQINKADEKGRNKWTEFFFISEADRGIITDEVICEIAKRALNGGSLTIRDRLGGVLPEPQFTRFRSEMFKLEMAKPAQGNQAPYLTQKGKVIFRVVARGA